MAILGTMDESITVTTSKQSLYDILAAINANAPRNVCRVDIIGEAALTQDVFIGNSRLTDTNYFQTMKASAGGTYSDNSENKNAIALNQIYLKAKDATSSQTLHVKVRVF